MSVQSTPEQQRVRVCRALDIKRKIDNFRNISCVVSLVHCTDMSYLFTLLCICLASRAQSVCVNKEELPWTGHVLISIKACVKG